MTQGQLLEQHGIPGQQLLNMARSVANREKDRRGSTLGHKQDDLIGFLNLQACTWIRKYDPTLAGNGYKLESQIWDRMEHWCDDFYRRKSEGFGDRRYGNDNRLVLTDGSDDDADPDIDFDKLISERQFLRWQSAADKSELPLREWIIIVLEIAARHQLKEAA